MPTYRKTPVAVEEAGTTYTKAMSLIRTRKMAPPAKDSSGDFIWGDEDVERLRQALLSVRRPRKAAVSQEAAHA